MIWSTPSRGPVSRKLSTYLRHGRPSKSCNMWSGKKSEVWGGLCGKHAFNNDRKCKIFDLEERNQSFWIKADKEPIRKRTRISGWTREGTGDGTVVPFVFICSGKMKKPRSLVGRAGHEFWTEASLLRSEIGLCILSNVASVCGRAQYFPLRMQSPYIF